MTSPVEIARRFARLKSGLSQAPAADHRLLLLVEFLRDFGPILRQPPCRTYLDEWRALVSHQLGSPDCLIDLTPDELQQVMSISGEDLSRPDAAAIRTELATKLCYVGEASRAVALLTDSADDEGNQPDSEAAATADELELARRVLNALPEDSPEAGRMEEILGNWRLEREALNFDSVKCLFVDKNGHGEGRGRMRTLTCRNAEMGRKLEADEVVFDNQVRGPDDPFVGASYSALASVRKVLTHRDIAGNHSHLRVHVGIEGSGASFTGDSIALAVALVSYAMLLRPEIHRHERFISGEIAVTGSLGADGALMAVNAGTLANKIERAFFSPVRYVVAPQGNAPAARETVARLREKYPRRRLQVIAHESLSDVITDHNVIRPEKVCMGAFVARKARRYTGSIRVQAPILLGLTWLLLALLWPKYFDPWFDWHIAEVGIESNRVVTRNARRQVVFRTDPVGFEVDSEFFRGQSRFIHVDDIDQDGADELFMSPVSFAQTGAVRLYDDDGSILWNLPASVPLSYGMSPQSGNNSDESAYGPARIRPWSDSSGAVYVLSASFASSPDRDQLRLFGVEGAHSSESYIHTGVVNMVSTLLVDVDRDGTDEILAWGVNNFYGLGILVLDPRNLIGVSPPWNTEMFLSSGLPHGSHKYYVRIPKTPLGDTSERYTVCTRMFYDSTTRAISLEAVEGANTHINGRELDTRSELPILCYQLDSNLIPTNLYPGDSQIDLLNQLLVAIGKEPIASWERLRDSLLSEVVVYHGDSIVHHLAAGIDFYSR